mgnify:CR=1 FL=1
MFKKRLGFRIEPKLKMEIEKLVKINRHRYESSSQFIRVAIINQINKTRRELYEIAKKCSRSGWRNWMPI